LNLLKQTIKITIKKKNKQFSKPFAFADNVQSISQPISFPSRVSGDEVKTEAYPRKPRQEQQTLYLQPDCKIRSCRYHGNLKRKKFRKKEKKKKRETQAKGLGTRNYTETQQCQVIR
jgi:hypothetical protein